MNIWILNHYATPATGSAGARHAILGHYLALSGHQVTVLAGDFMHAHYQACEIPAGRRWHDEWRRGVRFRFVRVRPFKSTAGRLRNMMSYAHNAPRATEGLGRPDVVIGSCVHLHAAAAAAELARRHRCQFVFEIRDVWPESLAEVGALSPWHPVYSYLKSIERRAFRRADGVLTVLPNLFEYCHERRVPRHRVCYAPNGVDPQFAVQCEAPPPESGPFVISFFGAHGRANGLRHVVDAARRVAAEPAGRDIRFQLVGAGPEKANLARRVSELGLGNVEMRDSVPRSELAALARKSHAFLFTLEPMQTLEKYGLSANKLFDYMAAARPVIFACRSSNNPVAEAQAGVSVRPADPVALSRAILDLRGENPARLRSMGRRGRAYVLARHNLANIAGRVEEFLYRLSRDNSTGRPRRLQAA